MVGKKKAKEGPGQALMKQRRRASESRWGAAGEERQALESITQVTDLEEVLEQVEHAERIFSALHPLPQLLNSNDSVGEFTRLDVSEKRVQQRLEEALHESSLTVPRRPKWHVGMTLEELDSQEREAFLEWRRGLARLEDNEKLVITPFEKNLDIWRQLWRVIERCDLIVMVVDARNPLFYRCPDLEAYITEIDTNKRIILLLNKADLIPASIRSKWARYFKSQNIKFLFWSAKDANILLENNGHVNVETQPRTSTGGSFEQRNTNCLEEDVRIFGRDELLNRLQCEAEIIVNHCGESSYRFQDLTGKPSSDKLLSHRQIETEDEDANKKECAQHGSKHVAVGFVGYPNVGKSSTINALIGGKRTGVTSTPGKTKHFQTFIINDRLTLCDCPGLVFPLFTSSKSEMVASGVLPIDRMTDYRGPVQAVANQIPRATLEKTYGLFLPSPKPYEPQDRPLSAAEILRSFALSRGYVISSGLPDETRAARQILKDYLNGKLLYCHTPPDESQPLSSEVHNDEGLDGSEVEGSACLEFRKGDEQMGQNSELTEARKEPLLDGQTISAADWSKLDGIFRDVEPPIIRDDGSLARLSSYKMHQKLPRKKDRSWRVKDEDCDGMSGISGVSKPVSGETASLGQIIT